MSYELPRTESGDVDWGSVQIEYAVAVDFADGSSLDILKALDANARKEERERCAEYVHDATRKPRGASGDCFDDRARTGEYLCRQLCASGDE